VLSRAGLAEARRKTTENLEAYDCVLRTYEYLHIHTAAKHLTARDCLERAVKLDPGYPDAWAWLGYTYAEENRHQWNAQPAPLERALAVTERAIKLDGANQVAHGVLALIYFARDELDRFTVEAEKTVALNPNNAMWLGILGSYLAPLGNWERGLSMVKKALALNPNPPDWIYIPFFLDHYRNGRYAAALGEAQKITTEDVYRSQLFLAAAYGQLGRRAEARVAIRKLVSLRPDFRKGVGEDLRRRYGYPDGLTEQLMDGLRKAGLDE
jgi:tetratricopeptide (TPR) repeat protein